MKNLLKGLMVAGVFGLGVVLGLELNNKVVEKPIEKPVEIIEEVYTTEKVKVVDTYYQEGTDQKYGDFYLEDGDTLTLLSDGSWSICNKKSNLYIFQPVDLGDWDYELDNAEQLEKIVKTYISIKNTGSY